MKSRHVALILSLNKRFDRKVGEGIARFIHEAGNWSVFIEDDPSAKIPDFSRGSFNGVIADLDDLRIPSSIAGLRIPVVGIGSIDPNNALCPRLSTVGTDNESIAHMAAEYLTGLRLASYAYCGITTGTIDIWNQERQAAFVRQLRGAHLECSVFKDHYNPSHSWEHLQKALFDWLNSLPKPIGVLAANDVRARHLLEACRRYGLRVPDDVCILGVDNDELICELATPTLSSIIQGTEEIGYRAALTLDRLMRRRGRGSAGRSSQVRVAPVSLMERASTDLLTTDDRLVAAALEYIREHACDGIGVTQVATGLNVSRSTLDNRFAAKTGRSVHAEIVRVQMNAARHLLLASNLCVAKVALRVGFCHAQYFSTAFRRHHGITPGDYRRQAR